MKRALLSSFLVCAVALTSAQKTLKEGEMPQLPKFPEIPAKMPIGSVKMGDNKSFADVQLDIPITDGPYKASWESIELHVSK